MDVSIIIISYNTKKYTDDCLASIYRNLKEVSFTSEVLVVDNASTDGTREMIEKKYKRVIRIENRENIGFGKGNNEGIRKATGDYILLLNSDTVVLPNAIQKLFQFSQKHKNSFVGPKLLNINRSSQTSCGPFMSLPVVFAALFLKGDYLGITRWSPSKTKEVDWVSGACIMAPKALFSDGLLFDESIFMYMEEIDLLYRAKQKGYSVYFYPAAQVIHMGSGSSVNKRKGPILNIYKGFIYFYTKHYSGSQLVMLKVLLRLKALIAIVFGSITRNDFLRETYDEAYKLV